MLIRILRSTMAAPMGEPARAVDAGEVLDVEYLAAMQLIATGKAAPVEVMAPTGGIIETPEDALTEMEIRPVPRKGKRR